MGIYKDSAYFITCFDQLIDGIKASYPQATEAMLQSKLTIHFQLRDPTTEIFVDARRRPLSITYGPPSQKAALEVALDTDTLHQILLGEMTLTKAVGKKLLLPKGPIWKATALADLFKFGQEIYPGLIADIDS